MLNDNPEYKFTPNQSSQGNFIWLFFLCHLIWNVAKINSHYTPVFMPNSIYLGKKLI